jgi:hypothetical protein
MTKVSGARVCVAAVRCREECLVVSLEKTTLFVICKLPDPQSNETLLSSLESGCGALYKLNVAGCDNQATQHCLTDPTLTNLMFEFPNP